MVTNFLFITLFYTEYYSYKLFLNKYRNYRSWQDSNPGLVSQLLRLGALPLNQGHIIQSLGRTA